MLSPALSFFPCKVWAGDSITVGEKGGVSEAGCPCGCNALTAKVYVVHLQHNRWEKGGDTSHCCREGALSGEQHSQSNSKVDVKA